jgi:hypothetical protein
LADARESRVIDRRDDRLAEVLQPVAHPPPKPLDSDVISQGDVEIFVDVRARDELISVPEGRSLSPRLGQQRQNRPFVLFVIPSIVSF